MKTLCIYCGSSIGSDPAYADAARAMGAAMVAAGIDLVYGGGRVGLMGTIADAVLAGGGSAIGVIPQALMQREVGHRSLTRLEVVGSMHERKARMAELSDGFVALPGGLGTLEELFEMLTWSQLGLHAKPVGALNVAGFYDGLIDFIARQVRSGFVRESQAALLLASAQPGELIEWMRVWQAPASTKVSDALAAAQLKA